MDLYAYDHEEEIATIEKMDKWSKLKYFSAQIGAIMGFILFCYFKPLGTNSVVFTLGTFGSIIFSGVFTFIFLTALQRFLNRNR